MLNKTAHDLDRKLIWRDPETALEEIALLIKKPPLRSVVATIYPKVAAAILEKYNTQNRRFKNNLQNDVTAAVSSDAFELTGDAIKFSKGALLIDGQHRLRASVISEKPITTHVVFGLDDKVFDVLDQGRKRTPSDVLQLCGIEDATWVAGAIRWIAAMEQGKTPMHISLSARDIRALAQGRFKDMKECLAAGRLVNKAFKHPPTFIAALVFLIANHNESLASRFIHEWVHGARVGRNESFDVLSSRLMSIQRQSGGHINYTVRAALIVQTFNAWNADESVTGRALSWKLYQEFPKLEFNKTAYLKKREKLLLAEDDERLTENQRSVLRIMKENQDAKSRVKMTLSEIARESGIQRGSVPAVMNSLEDKGLIHIITPSSGPGSTSIYGVVDQTEKNMAEEATAG